jgi:hypothetical protein
MSATLAVPPGPGFVHAASSLSCSQGNRIPRVWVTVHSLSGLALGTLLPLPLPLVLLAALVLHLLLDLVPHWDYTHDRRRGYWAVLDVALSVVWVVILVLSMGLTTRAILAAIVSAVPDLDVLDAIFPWKRRGRWFPSHWVRFPHGQTGPFLGISVQLLAIAGSVLAVILVST